MLTTLFFEPRTNRIAHSQNLVLAYIYQKSDHLWSIVFSDYDLLTSLLIHEIEYKYEFYVKLIITFWFKFQCWRFLCWIKDLHAFPYL